MNKRLTAVALAVASLPLTVVTTVATAGPATAAPGSNCGAYPPGQAYGIRRNPNYALVNRGAVVSLSARVFRGGENCSERRVGFYQRNRGASQFALPEANKTTTLNGGTATGLAIVKVRANDDFRWFANYNSSASVIGARSSGALVQVRR